MRCPLLFPFSSPHHRNIVVNKPATSKNKTIETCFDRLRQLKLPLPAPSCAAADCCICIICVDIILAFQETRPFLAFAQVTSFPGPKYMLKLAPCLAPRSLPTRPTVSRSWSADSSVIIFPLPLSFLLSVQRSFLSIVRFFVFVGPFFLSSFLSFFLPGRVVACPFLEETAIAQDRFHSCRDSSPADQKRGWSFFELNKT